MANVTINNTAKSGFLTINFGSYYPSVSKHKEIYSRISDDFGGVHTIEQDGFEGIELHLKTSDTSIFLHYTSTTNYKIVDSVNGVAPTSLTDLRDKILALIP